MATDTYFTWRWKVDENDQDSKPIKVSEDRLSVIFNPRQSQCCIVVRGDTPLLKHMEHWYEVEVSPPFHGQARMVGLGDKYTRLMSSSKDFYPLIGRDCSSWGLNYTGKILYDGEVRDYVPAQDIPDNKTTPLKMGVYFDSYYGNIAFTMNDKNYGIAFQNISLTVDLYPMICASSKDCQIKLTYNHSSIISLKALCRGTIRLYISKEDDVDTLPIPNHLKAYLLFKGYVLPKTGSRSSDYL